MKTNKSYIKRLKITRSGKLLARKPGQDHFNAKETGEERLKGKQPTEFKMSNKAKIRFLGK